MATARNLPAAPALRAMQERLGDQARTDATKGAGAKKHKLDTFGPGSVFGETALLDGGPRTATIVALEDAECLVLSRWDFVAELQTNPHMAVAMLPILSKRLRQTDERLANM